MATEQRVSRLEGGYEHLATKADLADLKTELKTDISELRADFTELRGQVRLLIVGMTAVLSILNIVLRFIG